MSLRSHFTQEGELEISGEHMMLLHDCVYSCYGLIELVNTKREFENIISEHNDILPHNSIKFQTASSCLLAIFMYTRL